MSGVAVIIQEWSGTATGKANRGRRLDFPSRDRQGAVWPDRSLTVAARKIEAPSAVSLASCSPAPFLDNDSDTGHPSRTHPMRCLLYLFALALLSVPSRLDAQPLGLKVP